MPIVFERTRVECNSQAEDMLVRYFLVEGRQFGSLSEALDREYGEGKKLGDFLTPEPVNGTLRVTDLPANYDPVTHVRILWRQFEDYGRFQIELPGIPVLTARVVD